MRKPWKLRLAALGAVFCLLAPAAAQQAGSADYTPIGQAQPTDDPARIEVIEFFSFACPHCNDLNPLIHEWAGKLPRDVYFKRVPVNFNPFYKLMSQLFYTLDATGDLARLDGVVFEAIHEKGLRLVAEKSIAEWAASQGVNARRFSEAWNSFSVNSKMRRADQMTQDHKIQGVPALVVDGRYLVSGKGLAEMLAATDRVVAMRRAERQAGAKKK